RRARDELRADQSARTRPCLDEERLAERLRHFVGHCTDGDFLVPAGGDGHDDPDRLRGIALCPGGGGAQHKYQEPYHCFLRSVCRYSTDCISCRRLTVR